MTDAAERDYYQDEDFQSEDAQGDTWNEVVEIEDSTYDATITSIRTGMSKDWDTGEPKKQYVWRFAVERAPGDVVELAGFTSTSTNEKSKLTEWMKAMFGPKKLNEPNVRISYQDDVVGLPVRVRVGHGQQSGKPKVTDIIEQRK